MPDNAAGPADNAAGYKATQWRLCKMGYEASQCRAELGSDSGDTGCGAHAYMTTLYALTLCDVGVKGLRALSCTESGVWLVPLDASTAARIAACPKLRPEVMRLCALSGSESYGVQALLDALHTPVSRYAFLNAIDEV
eukprot:3350225-Rhodomonas_salina.2